MSYIDDSKGTNVGATLAAVAGMPGPLVHDRWAATARTRTSRRSRRRFAARCGTRCSSGATRRASRRRSRGVCTLERCATLPQAVRAAARAARPGDTVLLSPACASLDMFRDYAHRGAVFAQAVQELAA